MLLHTLPMVLVMAVVILLVSISAQLIISKAFKQTFLEEHADIVTPLLGVVGTLFSVLLGFMVGGAMDRYHDAMVNVDLEANSVANVFRLAKGLDAPDRVRIRHLCREYVKDVVEHEWKEMNLHEAKESAWDSYQALWDATLGIEPGNDQRISNIQQSIMGGIKILGENRRARLVTSQHGLTAIQWLVLGLGGAITVVFCLFFPMRKASFHTFLTGLVSVSLGLNIWLLAAYSTPFSGELQIQPYMFTFNSKLALQSPDDAPRFLKPKVQPGEPVPQKTSSKSAGN